MAKLDIGQVGGGLVEHQGMHWSRSGTVFGEANGMPVHVALVEKGDQPFLAVIVGVASDEAAVAVREAWSAADELDDLLARRRIEIELASVIARLPQSKASKLGPDGVEKLVLQLTSIAASVPGASPQRLHGSRPGLVNGAPRYLEDHDVAALEFEGRAAEQEYGEMQPRIGPAVGLGLVGAVATAVAWGLIGAYTNRSFWLVAIGGGLVIGYLVIFGARKVNPWIQALIVVLTLGSILVGEILVAAFVINDTFGVFDLSLAVEIYFDNVDGSSLFAFGGGVIGAFLGARLARRPQISAEVEIAPL